MPVLRGAARFTVFALATALAACGSSQPSSAPQDDAGKTGFADGAGAPGEPGFPGQDGPQPPIPTLAVESIVADLSGPFAPAESARRPVIPEAIANSHADVVCVSEVWSDADAQNVIEAAKARFPYAARVATDLDTLPTDPRDQFGKVPADPTMPPCDANDLANLRTLDACLVANCATKPGDPTAPLLDGAAECISSSCTAQATTLLFAPNPSCWVCAADAWFSRVGPAVYEKTCSTDTRRPLAFAGANGVIVLSKLPIGTKELEVLPATDFRAAVLRVPVLASRVVDVYCADVDGRIAGSSRPYAGVYGGGAATSDDQWHAEFLLQAQRIAAFVKLRSGAIGRPAIVAGMLGLTFSGDTKTPAYAPDVDQAYASTLTIAVDPKTAACTSCVDNPLLNAWPYPPSGWSNVFYQLTSAALPVVAADVTHREPIVQWNGQPVPISPEYGFRVTFALSQ